MVRKAAFDWLEDQQRHHGDVLPREVLHRGFEWQGKRVPLVSAQGIFKPRVLPKTPLTITTFPNGPYEDSFEDDHRLRCRYRGSDLQAAGKAAMVGEYLVNKFSYRHQSPPTPDGAGETTSKTALSLTAIFL